VLILLSVQSSQPQALTTDHETWHYIHVFLNAYRKTSPAPCLATFTLNCKQYSWHALTCQSSQFTMQQFITIMHESFLCVMILRTKSDNPRILTLTKKLCRTNVLMLLSEQNSKPQALTTDHETWHCIHVFLNAYRKTSTAPCLATSSLSCNQYSWHAWKCNSSQLTMQGFESIVHESLLCLKVVGVSCVCCTNTPTN
jgi:hypothetical protein